MMAHLCGVTGWSLGMRMEGWGFFCYFAIQMQVFAYYQKSLVQQNALKSPYTVLKFEFTVA